MGSVMNGSVALDVAVAALRIGPDDEVIYDYIIAAAVIRAGATPVGWIPNHSLPPNRI
jgi:perosamine synthetase